jgi:hypothetical protein
VVIHENYDQETKVDKQTNQISLSSIWLLLFRNLGQQHCHCDARVARQIHGQNFDRLRAESVPPRRLFRLRADSRMGKRQGRRKKFGCPPPNERWDGQQPMVYWNSHAQKWISRPHDVRHCNSRILSGRAKYFDGRLSTRYIWLNWIILCWGASSVELRRRPVDPARILSHPRLPLGSIWHSDSRKWYEIILKEFFVNYFQLGELKLMRVLSI